MILVPKNPEQSKRMILKFSVPMLISWKNSAVLLFAVQYVLFIIFFWVCDRFRAVAALGLSPFA
jgi:hypothetical protein